MVKYYVKVVSLACGWKLTFRGKMTDSFMWSSGQCKILITYCNKCSKGFRILNCLYSNSSIVASARLCCLSRVPPAVCPSLLESATTAVCTCFLQSLSTYVCTPTPHSILRFRPAPQTPDLHTFNLPQLVVKRRKALRSEGRAMWMKRIRGPELGSNWRLANAKISILRKNSPDAAYLYVYAYMHQRG